ncbi:MAG: hypothetical protein JWM78_37 [Verrucomicrobiaceae bacterium]|nr:hypothetical protein [Verrucomicrobiaceae bacterium]
MSENSEIKPSCPKCGETGFIAMADAHVKNADKSIALIVCAGANCSAVIGVLPFADVFEKLGQ